MAKNGIRIRMYRVGFGDCFLVSLPQQRGHAHVLIDCGVHSAGDLGLMTAVVENVAEETQGHISVVVASHEHQDHISGFASASRTFSRIQADEAWLPWTSDPSNARARRLRRKQVALAESLKRALTGASSRASRAALDLALNARSNAKAMEVIRSGFRKPPRLRYLTAGQRLRKPAGVEGLEALVLGPPTDDRALARMDPPKAQRYLRADGASRAGEGVDPFPRALPLAKGDPRAEVLTERERNDLRAAVSVSPEALAFALDRAVNNTSLVLLLRHRGRSLLFPGDAQWGSWQSWLAREDAESILDDVDVIKVSHHGSHNGTPRDAVKGLSNFVALASTQSKPWPSIPRLPLLEALQDQGGTVVRSDTLRVPGAREVKAPWKRLPAGLTAGEFWYDLHLGAKS